MSGSEVKSYSSIDPGILERAKKEIGEDDERIDATLKIIQEWLKKQPHLACPPGKCNAMIDLKKLSLEIIAST